MYSHSSPVPSHGPSIPTHLLFYPSVCIPDSWFLIYYVAHLVKPWPSVWQLDWNYHLQTDEVISKYIKNCKNFFSPALYWEQIAMGRAPWWPPPSDFEWPVLCVDPVQESTAALSLQLYLMCYAQKTILESLCRRINLA